MPVTALVILAIAVVLMVAGGAIAFGQRPPREGDAPPVFYRRMIAGVMLGAFGAIVIVYVLTWQYATR